MSTAVLPDADEREALRWLKRRIDWDRSLDELRHPTPPVIARAPEPQVAEAPAERRAA